MARKPQKDIAVVRAEVLDLYCRRIQSMGAPQQRLLELAGIRTELIAVPNALVPLHNAYYLMELACRSLQTEHLGLHIGRTSTLQDLGDYGHNLVKASTIGAYLKQGTDYFNTLNSGERLWTSSHGAEYRLNFATGCSHYLGAYQAELVTMVLTVAMLRKATGSEWCPREVGFTYQGPEPMPPAAEFASSRIVQGCDLCYLTIPAPFLRIPLPKATADTTPVNKQVQTPVPKDLLHLVLAQVDALCTDNRDLHIDTVADSLAISRRSLQRAIDREGLSFQKLLTRYRMEKATGWLSTPEKSVTDIALDLGYTDATNFSRAFRRHTGCSPREFRAGFVRN